LGHVIRGHKHIIEHGNHPVMISNQARQLPDGIDDTTTLTDCAAKG